MSTSTVRWLVILGLGLGGAVLLAYLLGRSGAPADAPAPASRGPESRARPGRASPRAAPGLRAPAPDRASGRGAVPVLPGPGPVSLPDAGVTPPDRFAPPEDQFTLHPRMQARLAEMGVNERRIWTEKIIGNLENRVKAVDGRIAQHEAEGNPRAAHGERITRGRITDGIAALRRQLGRIDRVLQGRTHPDAGSP
jgi:hypothetical protein